MAYDNKKESNKALLVEAAWEVCNQVGGIYTVIRTKAPSVIAAWGDRYCLFGPYVHKNVTAFFDPVEEYDNPFGRAVLKLRQMGVEAHYGRWLVAGKPQVVLVNPYQVFDRLAQIKYDLWERHRISTDSIDALGEQVLGFGDLGRMFFSALASPEISQGAPIVAHFHEWMGAATAIPEIRRQNLPMSVVFTTHATILGRYLAGNNPSFYKDLPFYDWEKEAANFNIVPMVQIERAAAHGSHIFTTVSDVTAQECRHLLGRDVDVITPNGLNVERFEALHEFQNLHMMYKEKIHQFVMGHFFRSYKFDLDNTLYFFTSGRYEYTNKGYDLTLEALARLNAWMKQAGSEKTVVMFLITKRPVTTINPSALESRAVMEEIRQTCDEIKRQIGDRLFYEVAAGKNQKLPNLEDFVDEYWKLRLRRTLQSWKTDSLPMVITHIMQDDTKDEVLNFIRMSQMVNKPDDKVKVIYHPDFIQSSNPLFGMDYPEFVRGCHMGIFPSYYEPWGYTPPECIASGVPTVTSDLAGFGDYVLKNMPDHDERGIHVVKRRHGDFNRSANQLADYLFNFVRMDRRDRITLRNKVESSSVYLDWNALFVHYEKAYGYALQSQPA